MKSYNGYTSSERSSAGNYQRKLIKAGRLTTPDRCDVCDVSHRESGKKIDRHNENYTDPLAFYPLCTTCHSRLHKRFENWENWKAVVVKGYRPTLGAVKEMDLSAYGDKWFHLLKSYEEPLKRREFEGS